MVTGVCGPTMTANVIGAPIAHPPKETPAKSDRRSNKPIMEKRRRARINNCLNELKTLILDATKKDPARHSKLEKADILEKTVKHLQELQRQQAVMKQAADPKIINKFKAGFADCVSEVSRFPGLDPSVKRRLLQHLQNCINGVKTELHHHQRQVNGNSAAVQHLHSQILPSPPSSPEQDHHLHHQHQLRHHHAQQQQQKQQQQQQLQQQQQQFLLNSHIQYTPNGYFLPNGAQVIPTKMANGTIALLMPQNLNSNQQQLTQQQQAVTSRAISGAQHANMYLNMPCRTASTGSASSNSSYEQAYTNQPAIMHCGPPSPANSQETVEYKLSVIHHAPALTHSPNNQQPLALVTKKQIKEEDQPWRPW